MTIAFFSSVAPAARKAAFASRDACAAFVPCGEEAAGAGRLGDGGGHDGHSFGHGGSGGHSGDGHGGGSGLVRGADAVGWRVLANTYLRACLAGGGVCEAVTLMAKVADQRPS